MEGFLRMPRAAGQGKWEVGTGTAGQVGRSHLGSASSGASYAVVTEKATQEPPHIQSTLQPALRQQLPTTSIIKDIKSLLFVQITILSVCHSSNYIRGKKACQMLLITNVK